MHSRSVYTNNRLQKWLIIASHFSVPQNCTNEEYECGGVCLSFITVCDGNADCLIGGVPQDELPALCDTPGIHSYNIIVHTRICSIRHHMQPLNEHAAVIIRVLTTLNSCFSSL